MLFLDKCYLAVKRSHEFARQSRMDLIYQIELMSHFGQRKQNSELDLTLPIRFKHLRKIKKYL